MPCESGSALCCFRVVALRAWLFSDRAKPARAVDAHQFAPACSPPRGRGLGSRLTRFSRHAQTQGSSFAVSSEGQEGGNILGMVQLTTSERAPAAVPSAGAAGVRSRGPIAFARRVPQTHHTANLTPGAWASR